VDNLYSIIFDIASFFHLILICTYNPRENLLKKRGRKKEKRGQKKGTEKRGRKKKKKGTGYFYSTISREKREKRGYFYSTISTFFEVYFIDYSVKL